MIEHWTFHQLLRWLHIFFGFVGLVAFWMPVFAKKGGRFHIRAGWVFVTCAYVVGVSAVVSCVWALVDPRGFAQLPPDLGADVVARVSGELRFFFGLLAVLGLGVVSAVETGIPVLRTRRQPEKLDSTRRRAVYLLMGAGAASLLAFGIWHLANGDSRYGIWVGIGALILADARGAWRHMKNPLPTPMAWWYCHMETMLGAGIAFHTAFAVFGSGRLLGFRPEGALALLPWVLPSLIGVPAISIWVRHYKRKFGELEVPRPTPAPTVAR